MWGRLGCLAAVASLLAVLQGSGETLRAAVPAVNTIILDAAAAARSDPQWPAVPGKRNPVPLVAQPDASRPSEPERSAAESVTGAQDDTKAESTAGGAADSAENAPKPLAEPERLPPRPPDKGGRLPDRLPTEDGPPRPPPRTAAEIIQDFDRNDDGVLEVDEIPFDQRRHIMRADADRNGIVVEEELDVFLILFAPPPPR